MNHLYRNFSKKHASRLCLALFEIGLGMEQGTFFKKKDEMCHNRRYLVKFRNVRNHNYDIFCFKILIFEQSHYSQTTDGLSEFGGIFNTIRR